MWDMAHLLCVQVVLSPMSFLDTDAPLWPRCQGILHWIPFSSDFSVVVLFSLTGCGLFRLNKEEMRECRVFTLPYIDMYSHVVVRFGLTHPTNRLHLLGHVDRFLSSLCPRVLTAGEHTAF